jgi:5-methylcytosine-specific restriction endonuclease McrA
MKLPSFQFYPGDWMKDPELRSVSLAARGLWIDMLSLMFECDRRGYLQLNGKPVNADQLARMTGCSTGEVSHCLQELDDSGVFSRSDDGTIYSRRLVRDEKKRANLRIRMDRFRQNGGGDPYRWAVVRVSILKRDGEICAYCGKRANTVDHITPRSDGGGESSSNLVACCKACNMKKSNRTPEQAGMEFWKGFNRNVLLTPLVTPTETPPFEDEDEIEVEITKPESLGKNPKTIKEVAIGFELKDAFNATEHAKMVAGELRISSWQVIEAIRLQLELETEKSGKPFEAITLQLIANGQDFSKSRKDMNFPWGWEKFFSEGHWRDRSSWPWKAGGNGKPVSAIAQLKKIKGE